jgi:GNAT superfamily N-acetyltransferase
MDTISIRPPQPAELPLVHGWLPFPFQCPGSVLGLVAVRAEDGACPGAVTLNALTDDQHELFGGVAIYVEPGSRGRGIGRRLLQAAYGLAEETGMARVATLDLVPEGSELHAFLLGMGMQPTATLTAYALPLAATLATLEAKYQALAELLRRGHGPALEDVRSLVDVEPEAVLRFVQSQGGSIIGTTLAKLTSEAYRSTSTVLWEEGQISGVVLAIVQGDSSYIDLLLVAPHKRRSTAELVLLIAAARRALDLGIREVVFEGDATAHPFPVRLGRRLQGRPVGTRLTLGIDLESMRSEVR